MPRPTQIRWLLLLAAGLVIASVYLTAPNWLDGRGPNSLAKFIINEAIVCPTALEWLGGDRSALPPSAQPSCEAAVQRDLQRAAFWLTTTVLASYLMWKNDRSGDRSARGSAIAAVLPS